MRDNETIATEATTDLYTLSGATTYGYDAYNRLTSAGSATLTYDPASRLSQTAGAATTRFLSDGGEVIAEYNTSGTLLRRFVHGPGVDEPIVWYEGSGTSDRRWLVQNEQNTVIAVTNAAGAALTINTYDEYGVPGSSNAGRFQFTGQMWLPEASQYYFKARMYAATLGRFMQPDPIGQDGGLNIYEYVEGDPINFTDPFGLEHAPAPDSNAPCAWPIICVTAPRPEWPSNFASLLGGGSWVDDVGTTVDEAGGEIVVTGQRRRRGQLSGNLASVSSFNVSAFLGAVGHCTASHFGLDEIVGAGLTASGANVIATGAKLGNATKGTSVASVVSRTILGGPGQTNILGGAAVRLPELINGGRWLAPTTRALGLTTRFAGNFAGRWIPIVGAGILAYDAISIGICVANS